MLYLYLTCIKCIYFQKGQKSFKLRVRHNCLQALEFYALARMSHFFSHENYMSDEMKRMINFMILRKWKYFFLKKNSDEKGL